MSTFVLFNNFYGNAIDDIAELACLSFSRHQFPKECADIWHFLVSDLTLTAMLACSSDERRGLGKSFGPWSL